MSDQKISKTFKEVGQEFIDMPQMFPNDVTDPEQAAKGFKLGVELFAEHLDGFRTLDSNLQILAYQRSREIDGQVLKELAKLLPKEKVEEVIREVYNKHRHTNAEKNISE